MMSPPNDALRPRILVAEDESVIAMQIEELLESEGYECVGVVANAQQAIDQARTLKPDLVLMDIVMPGDLDGIDACALIQRELNIPVVLLSAHGEEHYLNRARSALPSGYLLKPCHNAQIRAAIEVALAMRAHADPSAGLRLREAHHRIKNSFALLHSMLRLQEVQMQDPQARQALSDAGARVMALASAHEAMTAPTQDSRFGSRPYLEHLARDLFDANAEQSRLRLELKVDDAALHPSKLVPCGILLAEAMTNSVRHAFPDGRDGCITVSLQTDDREACLTVSDDGVGLPAPLGQMGKSTFGLQCLQAAAQQLGGRLEAQSGNGRGTSLSVRFPLG